MLTKIRNAKGNKAKQRVSAVHRNMSQPCLINATPHPPVTLTLPIDRLLERVNTRCQRACSPTAGGVAFLWRSMRQTLTRTHRHHSGTSTAAPGPGGVGPAEAAAKAVRSGAGGATLFSARRAVSTGVIKVLGGAGGAKAVTAAAELPPVVAAIGGVSYIVRLLPQCNAGTQWLCEAAPGRVNGR